MNNFYQIQNSTLVPGKRLNGIHLIGLESQPGIKSFLRFLKGIEFWTAFRFPTTFKSGIVFLALQVGIIESVTSQNQINCEFEAYEYQLNGVNVSTPVRMDGLFHSQQVLSREGLHWPKDVNQTRFLASFGGLCLSGIDVADSNRLIVCAQAVYPGNIRTFWPGPLKGTNHPLASESCVWKQMFHADKKGIEDYITQLETSSLPLPESEIPYNILVWPGRNNPFLKNLAMTEGYLIDEEMDQDLAPFVDMDGDGIYNPAFGDYPDIGKRLSMVWWVMNDAGGKKMFYKDSNTVNIPSGGLEFQVTASTYPVLDEQHYLANCIFLDYKISNKGFRILNDAHVGLYLDGDVGMPFDDYTGCEVKRNLAAFYNGDPVDESIENFPGFGITNPTVGFKILDGPLAEPNDSIDNDYDGQVDEMNEKILFSSYMVPFSQESGKYGEPVIPMDFHRYLQALWKDGTHLTFGGFGNEPQSLNHPLCNFTYPSFQSDSVGYGFGGSIQNPVAINDHWMEYLNSNAPGQRLGIMGAGPFKLEPGQSFHYSFTNIVGYHQTMYYNESYQHVIQISDSIDAYMPNLHEHFVFRSPNGSSFSVFPNPGTDDFEILASGQIEKVKVIDSFGRISIEYSDLNVRRKSISLASLSPGVYFIQYQTTGGQGIKRLVKL
jgi:hypothetical protein